MNRLINKLEEKPLSGSEIQEACNDEIKIMTYKDLLNYNNIDDVFGNEDAVALLYETQPSYGHWTGLFRHSNYNPPTIEFFDSYGLFIDEQLGFVPKKLKNQLGEDYPYLSKLLYESPYEILYNPVQLQKRKKGISSCGRHVVFRCISANSLPLNEYINLLQSKNCINNPDEMVTYLTSFI
jgi:hypothetical protein